VDASEKTAKKIDQSDGRVKGEPMPAFGVAEAFPDERIGKEPPDLQSRSGEEAAEGFMIEEKAMVRVIEGEKRKPDPAPAQTVDG
jgi:hypothetical protein